MHKQHSSHSGTVLMLVPIVMNPRLESQRRSILVAVLLESMSDDEVAKTIVRRKADDILTLVVYRNYKQWDSRFADTGVVVNKSQCC